MFKRVTGTIFAVAVGLVPALVLAPAAPVAGASPATLQIGDASVWEADGGTHVLAAFAVAISDPVATSVTLTYQIVAGTATSPTDFNNLGGITKTLTFSPGGSTQKFISVKVYPDTANEPDETFTVSGISVVGGAVAGDIVATGTILDDDPNSAGVELNVSDADVYEGDSGPTHKAKLWVSLSEPSAGVVTVHAMTMSDSANAGVDYKDKMVSMVFTPGQVHKPFVVTVTPDGNAETDERFHVMLTLATGATIVDDTGYGLIKTDDSNNYVTTSFQLGPFNLSQYGVAGWESDTSAAAPRPAGAIAIKGMRFDIVDGSGTPVDMHAVHLHHIVVLDWSRTDAVCPSYPNRFTGAGKERTPMALGDNYAYRVGAADPAWSALWHIMNMSSSAKTVYIKYEIDYVGSADPTGANGVTSYWGDVSGPCTNSEYNIPGNGGAGSVHTATRTYTMPRAGTRLAVGGHQHDGGIDITLKRTASGQEICKNTAVYMDSMPGMLMDMTGCSNYTSVAAGEQFTTTSRYENDSFISGAMGIQVSYVHDT